MPNKIYPIITGFLLLAAAFASGMAFALQYKDPLLAI
jgi:hypothetical protein